MSVTVKELREFLEAYDDEQGVGIDEGGLMLVVLGDGTEATAIAVDGFLVSGYIELGGISPDSEHPGQNLDLWHAECGNLPACRCGLALAEADCCCSGTKEEVDGYVEALKRNGWPGAHAVEGPCPEAPKVG
jgi:hypothetical protein